VIENVQENNLAVIEFLDIILHPVYHFKHNISETGFILHFQGKAYSIGTSSIDWAQLSRLLPEDGNRIQSLKRFVFNEIQDNGLCPKTQ
jgi:hypothetical protein